MPLVDAIGVELEVLLMIAVVALVLSLVVMVVAASVVVVLSDVVVLSVVVVLVPLPPETLLDVDCESSSFATGRFSST